MKNVHSNKGFSLVEIMVGLVIGMLAMVVVMQVYAMFEGQKRASTGGSDAQTNGGVALFTLEREIRMAGYGLTSPNGLLCPKGINIYHDGNVVSNGASLAPVTIIDGGSGPDIITMVRSDSNFGAIPTSIIKQMPTPSSELTADGPAGLNENQLFLVGDPAGSKVCTLMQMSQDPQKTGNGWNLQHNSGQFPYNPPNPEKVFTDAPQYTIGDIIINMGSFVHRRYEILCNHLTEVNPTTVTAPYTCTNTILLVDQIVNIQAQYGVADTGKQQVNAWVDATGSWAQGTISADDVKRIKAVRIAVVARSPQYEKEAVTQTPLKLWAGGPDMALTADQQHYRYKVFETIVPMKNVIWANI